MLSIAQTVIHVRVTERHLPSGITQCYLPPDTGKRTPPQPQPDRPVLNLPTLEGWKAELTWAALGYITKVYLSVDSHTSHTLDNDPTGSLTHDISLLHCNSYATKPG